jgi:hypothetical protein
VVRATTAIKDERATHFLNVDLELKSRADLSPILVALGEKVVVLRSEKLRGIYYASLELCEFSRYVDPETCIARLVQLVRRLPPSARRCWKSARQRRFDIGVQAVGTGGPYATHITAATLRRVAEEDAEIAITVYAPSARERRVRPQQPKR